MGGRQMRYQGCCSFIIVCLLLLGSSAHGESRVRRFTTEELRFLWQDHEGVQKSCKHELLSHVPWWKVICEDREFRVDIWMEIQKHNSTDHYRYTLMYHVSEGVKSSGEKLVQFNSHFSHFVFAKDADLVQFESSIDVQNGLADLVVLVSPQTNR